MILKNKFFLLIFFFINFTSYNFNIQKKNTSIIFPIKEIIILNTLVIESDYLKDELEFLRKTSLFFLKKEKIAKIIDTHDFISSIQLKKKYPNTLIILVSEQVPIATVINKKKKYYLTKEGKKINFKELKVFEGLPSIFGNHKNFSSLYSKLQKNNFNISTIKAFYYFETGRWDVVLKDNRIIKLPEINHDKVIIEMDSILNNSNFSKYKIFDYRIKNQLILQ